MHQSRQGKGFTFSKHEGAPGETRAKDHRDQLASVRYTDDLMFLLEDTWNLDH